MSMMILVDAPDPVGLHTQGALIMMVLLLAMGLIYYRIHRSPKRRGKLKTPARRLRERPFPGEDRQERLLDHLLHSERRIKGQSRAPGGFGGGLGLGGTFGGGHFPEKKGKGDQ